jgi:hypothetical protein
VITCRPNVVAIGPQLATPVRPTQPWVLSIQLPRCDTLDHVHHLCRRISRRTTDQQVHVVRLHCQRFYFPIVACTYLADQPLQPLGYISSQYLAPVARYPHKVIRQSVNRMCTASGFHHNGDYSIARSSGPLRERHIADRASQPAALLTCLGPAFLPAASGGVSSRRIP